MATNNYDKENESPFNKKLKINTSTGYNNKKLDFLKNNRINEEINNMQSKKILNYREYLKIYLDDKKEISKEKKNKKSKSNEKKENKEIKIKLKNEINKYYNDKNYKKLDLSVNSSKNKIRKIRCFNSFYPKLEEKKILKFLNNEQFLTYSNINNNNITNNNITNNSELINKSIDVKKIYEISNKKQKKRNIKQRRNMSTDIDFISNNITDILYKSQNKKELKEQYSFDKRNIFITNQIKERKERNNDCLFQIIKKKEIYSNRSQYKINNKNFKNNSKFNLRNNLLVNIAKKYNKNKLNEIISDNTFNYFVIPKNNKSTDKSKSKSKKKNNVKSLLDTHKVSSSNKKIKNEISIYKKIMRNFYNYGRNNDNSNVHYQNLYGKNMKTRRTEYKQYFKNNNINYNISNNISNNINNININTSNNLINLITNITTNDDFQSLSGNLSTKKNNIKSTNVKHNLKNNNVINNSSFQIKKIKKKNDSQIISDTLFRLSNYDSYLNKKNSIEKNNNNNYIKNKFIKNNY